MYLYLKSPILRRLLTINKKLRISKSATYLIHCKLVIVYQHRACFRVKNTQSQESTIILSSYYYYYYYYLLLEAKKQNKSPPYVNSICIHLKIREKKIILFISDISYGVYQKLLKTFICIASLDFVGKLTDTNDKRYWTICYCRGIHVNIKMIILHIFCTYRVSQLIEISTLICSLERII